MRCIILLDLCTRWAKHQQLPLCSRGFTQLPSEYFSLLAGQIHLQTPAVFAELYYSPKCWLIYLAISIYLNFCLDANTPLSGTKASSLTASLFPSPIIARDKDSSCRSSYEKLQSHSVWFSTQTVCSPGDSAPLEKRGRARALCRMSRFCAFPWHSSRRTCTGRRAR